MATHPPRPGAPTRNRRSPSNGTTCLHSSGLSVPAPGLGVYDVRVTVPATGSYAEGATRTRVHARVPELRYGASEPAVGVLRRRLHALGYRSSEAGNQFGSDLEDAVLAFQKVQGLDRTGGVGPALWSALESDTAIRRRRPLLHRRV